MLQTMVISSLEGQSVRFYYSLKMKLMVQFRCERWKYLLRRACAESSVAVMISQQNFDCSMRKFGKRFFINFNTPECNN